MYNSCDSIVQTCFMNSLYNSNSVIGSKIGYFRAKHRINFTTLTRSRIRSARSDLSFVEGFNIAEIIEMIDYVSTS